MTTRFEIEALRAALEPIVDAGVATVDVHRSPYSTSHAIDVIEATLEDGSRRTMLRKSLGSGALLPDALGVRPDFLRDPLREIEMYRAVLPPDLGTPHFLGTVEDEASHLHWLFLERVHGVELWQTGDLETWALVARWLAEFHRRRLHETAPSDALGRLVRCDREFYERWPTRAVRHLADADDATRRAVHRVAACHDGLVERLLALPVTLVHGEFVAANVVVAPPTGPVARVCPVDWESASIGPGLIDLAMLAGGWSPPEAQTLADAYLAAARADDAWPHDESEFSAALDACRLHVCLRWLGWSPGWRPPPEHAQDWLAEAVVLVDRLAL